MAKLQQQQQQQKQQKQHFFICSTSGLLFVVTILLFCGAASGNGNFNVEGNHNNTAAFPLEQRIRREVPTTETEVKQATLAAHSENVEPEDIADKSIHLSEANDLERNFNPYKELNIFKRAPNGFIGMRGKKEQHDDDYFNPNSLDLSLDPLFHQTAIATDDEDYSDSAYAENERYKKAATAAFYGVRGKKFPNRVGSVYNRLSDMVQELEEERLRERMLQDFIGGLAVATAEQNEINKRAPTGFTGLRGKRPSWDWTGVDELASYEKRAPMNSFVGVRGKKDISNQQEMHQNLFKRSPSESFSGKRRLADFSNKFVAVRGKKDASAENADEERQAAQFVARQRLRYLVNFLPLFEAGRYGKRAPNGFVGMRGKRAAEIPSAAEESAVMMA